MAGYLILEFNTEPEAQACLAAINALAAQWWPTHGYTVEQGENGAELIGKANGVDNPDAARTVSWDVVKESPDGTFYINSLSKKQEFADWKQAFADMGFTAIGTEREYPSEWDED